MKNVANGLARYGRNGDNNLVHVSDKELAGIEQLTGRKFTTNPTTGLPEAFNFASLLPVAAGVAGTALAGPLGGAAAAGLTGAALGAAQGDSTERALTKGLIAGATTYAGGQLLSGIGDVGAAEAASQATSAMGPAIPDAAAQAAAQSSAGAGEVASLTPGLAAPAGGMPQIPSGFTPGMPQAPSYEAALESIKASQAAGVAQPSFSETLSNAGTAITNRPMDAAGQFISPKGAIFAGGTYATATDAFAPTKMPGETPYDPSKYPERFPSQPRQWNAPSSDYRAGYDPEYRYFAKGGLADLRQGNQETTANLMNEAKAALLGEHPKPQEAIERFRNAMGDDAFMALKDRITGGRIRGAGGGLDDLVPGTIEGRQKVRLADGEFILPSDIVSAIGDGSTDAGARRLHEMMDGIRKQKTGSTKQPGRLKAGSLVHEQ
jgi:hypothetical protein